jgi:hypothetical protein
MAQNDEPADFNPYDNIPQAAEPAPDVVPVLGGNQTAVEKASAFLSSFAANNSALALSNNAGDAPVPFFPPELIGGTAPHIPGQEDGMAWQSGAEAADSERLHYVWSVADGTLWYLAVRSQELASHTNSWCPFAALLPGQPQGSSEPGVYLYFDDEAAMMMSVGQNRLQIHRGATNVIQAKAERMAADLGGVKIVTLRPDIIDALNVVRWDSASLMEDKARRFLATAAVAVGLLVCVVAFTVWVLSSIASLGISHSVEAAQANASQSAQQLLQQATSLRASPLRNQVAKFIELNDNLINVGGWLQKYEIEGTRTMWSAVLPSAITGEKISELGGRTKEVTDEGMIVEGN